MKHTLSRSARFSSTKGTSIYADCSQAENSSLLGRFSRTRTTCTVGTLLRERELSCRAVASHARCSYST